ncbi:class I SAM-dependent methyltransferase [Methanocella conradii]|uniref:class I SAM-dependent methyltransferase n=1 Tax=Methanocella conradii TaxID=1175444 RepID=UPI0024B3493B|nr:class I SAM-dependent methyltransferase [Methanocella conradii]MDI6897737.1 class I SAM-dependent methyltransferase [Methanocella conradii]
MASHLKAWEDEYTRTAWRGPYDIGPMKAYLKKGARVLDVGCGNGKMLVPLARAGFDAVGVDFSRGALLTLAGQKAVQGDARSLPFKDSTFDAAVCYDVLQHLLEGERAAASMEAYRILAPGGLLFIQVFGKKDMRYGGTLVEPDTFRRRTGIVYHYFSEEEVRSMLSKFTVLSIESVISRKAFHGEEFTRHKIKAVAQK